MGRGNPSKQAHNSAGGGAGRGGECLCECPRFATALLGPVFGEETPSELLADGAGASCELFGTWAGVKQRGSQRRGASAPVWG